MKKLFMLSIIVGLLGANSIPMPPSFPSLNLQKKKKETKQVDPCSIVPPMLVNLPPMLEDDLIKCKNKRYLPTKKFAKKQLDKLLKIKVTVKSIKTMEKFNTLYEINTNKGKFYCNSNIEKCLKVIKIIGE